MDDCAHLGGRKQQRRQRVDLQGQTGKDSSSRFKVYVRSKHATLPRS